MRHRQIQSENQGDALAKNVIIRDKVPAYSTYEMGSLKYCLNLGCAPAAVTNEGEIVGSDIAFYVGTGSVPASQLGGDLQPGQQQLSGSAPRFNEPSGQPLR